MAPEPDNRPPDEPSPNVKPPTVCSPGPLALKVPPPATEITGRIAFVLKPSALAPAKATVAPAAIFTFDTDPSTGIPPPAPPEFNAKVPALTTTGPVMVFEDVSVSVPPPDLTSVPLPVMKLFIVCGFGLATARVALSMITPPTLPLLAVPSPNCNVPPTMDVVFVKVLAVATV